MYNQGVKITTSLKKNSSFFARSSFGIALICFLFIATSFNIAYHVTSRYAYVDGSFINYRDLILHIVDISVVFSVLWCWLYAGVRETKSVIFGTGLILFFVFIQLLSHPEVISIYGTVRIGLYCVCWLMMGEWLRKCLNGQACPDRKRYRLIILASLVVAAGLQSCIGILQYMNNRVLGIDILGESIVQVGGYGASSVYLPIGIFLRAYGTFPHPNLLGGFLAATGIIILFSFDIVYEYLKGIPTEGSRPKGKPSNIDFSIEKETVANWRISGMYVVLLAVISLGITATWSRSAITAWIIAIIIWACSLVMKQWKKKGMLRFLAVVSVLLFSVGLWVSVGGDKISGTIHERFINQLSTSDVSVSERAELNNEALKIISDKMTYGVGIYGFTKEVADSELFGQGGIRLIQPAHNVFLLAISEVGLLGVIFLAAFAFVLFSKMPLSGYTVASGIFLLIAMMTDHYLWTLPQGMAIWGIVLFGGIITDRRRYRMC